jgi:hypothetical protein
MNQVTKKKETSAIIADLVGNDVNMGFENVSGQEDLALPFLKKLGQLSPELNKSNASYVEGAQAGMILNTVTKELFDGTKGIKIIPCYYNREYIEWAERGQGTGAPVNIHPKDSAIMTTTESRQGKEYLPNGNYVEDTRSHFVLQLDDKYNPISEALLVMKGTQRKKSKNWMSQQMMQKLPDGRSMPSFGVIYTLKTVQESNDKGTWYGWDVTKDKVVDSKETFLRAKGFYESMKKGEKKVDHGSQDSASKTETETADVPF